MFLSLLTERKNHSKELFDAMAMFFMARDENIKDYTYLDDINMIVNCKVTKFLQYDYDSENLQGKSLRIVVK